jgi:phospholipid transport system transporter-binding protein
MSDSATFDCGPTLTHATATAAYRAGVARIEAGATRVDCAPLRQFDSAALAVLLGWRRAARGHGVTLQFLHFPAQLANLAGAYGIESLLLDARHPGAQPA